MNLKFHKKHLIILTLLIITISVGVFGFGQGVEANLWDLLSDPRVAVATIIGWLVILFVGLAGAILIVFINLLVWVAQYNGFMTSVAVTHGWVIIRDVANMGFIVVLLVIAFSTVLGIEQYSYKKMLPKLLIMAVLINFSKMICGFFIDFSQVIMMTFVNGFKDMAGGNFTQFLGIDKWLSLDWDQTAEGIKETGFWGVAISLLLALCMAVVALVVIGVMLVVLVGRMVALWILVVLSPIAFLCHAAPGGEKYSSQWWQAFGKYLIVGPVLAFFIWLSLTMSATFHRNKEYPIIVGETEETRQAQERMPSVGEAQIGTSQNILNYIIAIAMLIAGLMVTQSLGVVGGKLAGAAVGKMQALGTAPFKAGGRALWKGTKAATKAAAVGTARGLYIPALAKGIGAAVTRTQRGRRFLTKEGREEARIKKEAWGRAIFGEKGAERAAKDLAAKKRMESLEESGSFANSVVAEKEFENFVEKEDDIGARTMLRGMVEKGWLKEKHLRAYGQKFEKGGDLTTRQGRDFADFSIELQRIAKKEGIYKGRISDYEYDEIKGLIMLTPGEKATKMREDIEGLSIQDVRIKVDKDAVNTDLDRITGEAKNRTTGAVILGLHGHKDRFGQLSEGRRKLYKKAAEEVYINPEKFGIEGQEQMDKIKEVYDAASGKYSEQGIRTDRQKGGGIKHHISEAEVRKRVEAKMEKERRKIEVYTKGEPMADAEDRALANIVATSIKPHLENLGNVRAKFDTEILGGNLSSETAEKVFRSFNGVFKALESKAKELDRKGKTTGVVDKKTGEEKTNLKILQDTDVYRNITASRKAAARRITGERLDDDNKKKKAQEDLEKVFSRLMFQISKAFSPNTIEQKKKSYRKAEDRATVGFSEASEGFKKARDISDKEKRIEKYREASEKGISTLKSLLKDPLILRIVSKGTGKTEKGFIQADQILQKKITNLINLLDQAKTKKEISQQELNSYLIEMEEIKNKINSTVLGPEEK